MRIIIPKQPTDSNKRYKLWYQSRTVIVLESNACEITKVIAGPGQPKIIRGGRHLDWLLCQLDGELSAEPIG